MRSWNRTAAQFTSVGQEVERLFAVGADLLQHGKRLRAAFAAAGWLSAGGAELAPTAIRLGAGLELFQMAALVHDDLMDGSVTRRGRPAAHRQFESGHSELGLLGRGPEFGEAGAILLGDLLLVAAGHELEAAIEVAAPHARNRARDLVTTMMAEVTVGQYLDIYAQAAPWALDPQADLDRAHRVIRAKSARYSVEHPLTIGATVAGASPSAVEHLAQVGLPLGEAFQLRDDLLGVFGDPARTGKPAGDDLREGKRTVLVSLAYSQANEQERQVLRADLGRQHLTLEQIADLRRILTESGAVAQVEAMIADRYQRSMNALAAARLPHQADATIRALADATISRSA